MRTVILWMWWYAFALGIIVLLAEGYAPGITNEFMYQITF